ncbi:hypothetical protein GEMRC1_006770 [Eukaryota sp. GEM-RC1]
MSLCKYQHKLTLPAHMNCPFPLDFVQSVFLERCADLEIEVSTAIWIRFITRFSMVSSLKFLDFTSTGFGERSFCFLFDHLSSLEVSQTVFALDLSDNPVSDRASVSIASFLSSSPPRLSALVLRGCGLSPIASTTIIKSIAASPYITFLDLSSSSSGVRNHLGQEAAASIGDLLSNNVIRTLNLTGCGLGGHVSLFCSALSRCSSIRNLYLASNALGDHFDAVSDLVSIFSNGHHCGLQKISLSRNRFTSQAVKVLYKLITNSTVDLESLSPIDVPSCFGLIHLDLSHNHFYSSSDLCSLSSVLPGCLESINLSDCNVNDDMLQLLLPRVLKIKNVSLSKNKITDGGVSAIVRAFHSFQNSEIFESSTTNILDLSKNKIRSSPELPELVVDFSISKLNMADNNIRDSVILQLADVINLRGHQSVLSELNLSSNAIKVDGASKLVNELEKLPKISKILLFANDVTREIMYRVEEIIGSKTRDNNSSTISNLQTEIDRLDTLKMEIPALDNEIETENRSILKINTDKSTLNAKIKSHKEKILKSREVLDKSLADTRTTRKESEILMANVTDRLNLNKADNQSSVDRMMSKMERERKQKSVLEKNLKQIKTEFSHYDDEINEQLKISKSALQNISREFEFEQRMAESKIHSETVKSTKPASASKKKPPKRPKTKTSTRASSVPKVKKTPNRRAKTPPVPRGRSSSPQVLGTTKVRKSKIKTRSSSKSKTVCQMLTFLNLSWNQILKFLNLSLQRLPSRMFKWMRIWSTPN